MSTYDAMLLNARSFQNRYFCKSSPNRRATATSVIDPNLQMAWEAKKEVKLLRETMESMFQNFGETLQEVLQNERSTSSDERSAQATDELGSRQTLQDVQRHNRWPSNGQPMTRDEAESSTEKKWGIGGRSARDSKAISTVHVIEL